MPIVIAFSLIQLIVLFNAIVHDPRFGYDGPGHVDYVRALAAGRLPTPEDTHEFFSPPLPYILPAVVWRTFGGSSDERMQIIALKSAQIIQFFCSMIVCWSVLAIAKMIRVDRWMLLASLIGLGVVPTYYRTFAMVRGEPMMIAFLLLGTYCVFRCFAIDRPTFGRAILAGALLGGAVLSRQWAFFALPALGALGLWRLIIDRSNRQRTLGCGGALLLSFFLVGGGHYLHLQREYGSIRAFNRTSVQHDEEEQTKTGLPLADQGEVTPVLDTQREQASATTLLSTMICSPVRDAFDGHPFLLFYADTWGDYWRYFLISARDKRGKLVKSVFIDRMILAGSAKSATVTSMPAYLGRVCAVSIVPSLVLAGGLVYGVWRLRKLPRGVKQLADVVCSTATLVIGSTIAGYMWFVATYPAIRLDTVKATYPLQMLPFLAIVTAAAWCGLHDRFPFGAKVLGACVLIIFVHNLPAMVTRYTMW